MGFYRVDKSFYTNNLYNSKIKIMSGFFIIYITIDFSIMTYIILYSYAIKFTIGLLFIAGSSLPIAVAIGFYFVRIRIKYYVYILLGLLVPNFLLMRCIYAYGDILFGSIMILSGADCHLRDNRKSCEIMYSDSESDYSSGSFQRLYLLKTSYNATADRSLSALKDSNISMSTVISVIIFDNNHIIVRYIVA